MIATLQDTSPRSSRVNADPSPNRSCHHHVEHFFADSLPLQRLYIIANAALDSINSAGITMNSVRPPVLEAALQSCRLQRSPALRSALQQRIRASQTRCISGGPRPSAPGGGLQKTEVWAPKTRIAVGIVFIGSLIYSMVSKVCTV